MVGTVVTALHESLLGQMSQSHDTATCIFPGLTWYRAAYRCSALRGCLGLVPRPGIRWTGLKSGNQSVEDIVVRSDHLRCLFIRVVCTWHAVL